MAAPRLLVDIEVPDFLSTLARREQTELVKCFGAIAAFPSNHSDYTEQVSGRRVDVHAFRKFAIKYWNDAGDGHIKILDMHPADRRAK